jgi:hypothetical protein
MPIPGIEAVRNAAHTVSRSIRTHFAATQPTPDPNAEVRMDELCSWFEVIRSILPPSYEMRLSTRRRAIVVESATARPVVLTEADLAGRRPLEVIRALRVRLDSRRLSVA